MMKRLTLPPLLSAALSLASGCKSEPPASPTLPASMAALPASASAAPTTVPTNAPPPTDGPVLIAGDLRPSAAVELGFKAGGQLAQRKVERGARVKAGEVLAVLSDDEARAQLAQAEAAVAAAKAQAAIAEDAAGRVETLRGADAAPGNLAVSTKLQLEAARAMVKQAEGALALARANVNNHVLRAPFDAVVVRVPEGTGGMVAPGIPVFRLERLDPLVLQATVGETEVGRVRIGDVVHFRVGERDFSGAVRAVIGSLEAVTRRAPVEVEVANPDGALLAGAYVRAQVGGAAAVR